MEEKMKSLYRIALYVVVALLSMFVLTKITSNTAFYTNTVLALDEKKKTVLELAAAATGASGAVSLLPGDAATPIADKLADLSGYFLIVLCAIYLEKYLMPITGFVAFGIMVPIACVGFAVNEKYKNEIANLILIKLTALAIVLGTMIPASVWVSNRIENTYQESIRITMIEATNGSETVEDTGSSETGFATFIDNIANAADKGVEKFEGMLNHFIEAIAVLLVTSCVIPIVVLLFFMWLVKILLGQEIEIHTHRKE